MNSPQSRRNSSRGRATTRRRRKERSRRGTNSRTVPTPARGESTSFHLLSPSSLPIPPLSHNDTLRGAPPRDNFRAQPAPSAILIDLSNEEDDYPQRPNKRRRLGDIVIEIDDSDSRSRRVTFEERGILSSNNYTPDESETQMGICPDCLRRHARGRREYNSSSPPIPSLSNSSAHPFYDDEDEDEEESTYGEGDDDDDDEDDEFEGPTFPHSFSPIFPFTSFFSGFRVPSSAPSSSSSSSTSSPGTLIPCPICSRQFPLAMIESHAAFCAERQDWQREWSQQRRTARESKRSEYEQKLLELRQKVAREAKSGKLPPLPSEYTREECTCVICMELFIEPTITYCNHTFCKHCLLQLQKKENAECPLCRAPISDPVEKYRRNDKLVAWMRSKYPEEYKKREDEAKQWKEDFVCHSESDEEVPPWPFADLMGDGGEMEEEDEEEEEDGEDEEGRGRGRRSGPPSAMYFVSLLERLLGPFSGRTSMRNNDDVIRGGTGRRSSGGRGSSSTTTSTTTTTTTRRYSGGSRGGGSGGESEEASSLSGSTEDLPLLVESSDDEADA